MPGIVACSNCTSRFAEGVKFCGRCGGGTFILVSPGESAAATYPCPRCSAQLPLNSRFCGRCGLSITPAMQQHISAPPSFNTPPVLKPNPAERVCRRCGNAYPPHIRFCGRCGLTLL